jgi:hypothetical protein
MGEVYLRDDIYELIHLLAVRQSRHVVSAEELARAQVVVDPLHETAAPTGRSNMYMSENDFRLQSGCVLLVLSLDSKCQRHRRADKRTAKIIAASAAGITQMLH